MFDDGDTRRFLGDRGWAAAMLELAEHAAGREFRGARQIGALRFLALQDGVAVGYIDCGTFDCWTPPVMSRSRPRSSTGQLVAFVVAPSARRQGVAKAMIEALLVRPELANLRVVGAGVEPDNPASRQSRFDRHPYRGRVQPAGRRPRRRRDALFHSTTAAYCWRAR